MNANRMLQIDLTMLVPLLYHQAMTTITELIAVTEVLTAFAVSLILLGVLAFVFGVVALFLAIRAWRER